MHPDRIPPTHKPKKRRKWRSRTLQLGPFKREWLGEFSFHGSDLYHWLLRTTWLKFLGSIVGAYFTLNLLFALAYVAGGDGIENAKAGSFADAFFFSVQTMATIGYGAMYPKTPYTHVLVTIEVLIGLLGVAMATGLMFARFSRPTARVLFSQVATICPFNGVPTLMFRAANQRRHTIVEAQICVSLLRSEQSLEGDQMNRFYDLKLARAHSSFFAFSWTVMHPIDEDSPFYGKTPEELMKQEDEIVVMLTGLDETDSQTVHASYLYHLKDLRWNHRFVDIISVYADGSRHIDYSRFHETQPLGQESW